MINYAGYGYSRTLYHVSVRNGKIKTNERCNVMYYYRSKNTKLGIVVATLPLPKLQQPFTP
jgi:hypothetical protein